MVFFIIWRIIVKYAKKNQNKNKKNQKTQEVKYAAIFYCSKPRTKMVVSTEHIKAQ